MTRATRGMSVSVMAGTAWLQSERNMLGCLIESPLEQWRKRAWLLRL